MKDEQRPITTKVLHAESLTDVKAWDMPSVDGAEVVSLRSVNRTQSQYEKSRQDAVNQGYQEGIAQAQSEMQNKLAAFDPLFTLLAKPMSIIDEDIEQQLLQLVVTMTQQCIAKELTLQPELILTVIKACIKELPVTNTQYQLVLNSEDLELLKSALEQSKVQCDIQSDPSILRGEFKIESENTTIDATIAAKLAQVCEKQLDMD